MIFKLIFLISSQLRMNRRTLLRPEEMSVSTYKGTTFVFPVSSITESRSRKLRKPIQLLIDREMAKRFQNKRRGIDFQELERKYKVNRPIKILPDIPEITRIEIHHHIHHAQPHTILKKFKSGEPTVIQEKPLPPLPNALNGDSKTPSLTLAPTTQMPSIVTPQRPCRIFSNRKARVHPYDGYTDHQSTLLDEIDTENRDRLVAIGLTCVVCITGNACLLSTLV